MFLRRVLSMACIHGEQDSQCVQCQLISVNLTFVSVHVNPSQD